MKNLLIAISILYLFCQCTSDTKVADCDNSNLLTIGTIDSLYSDILKESRKILIHLPEGYNSADSTQAIKYPVVYLLDGDGHFYSVSGMIRQLSTVNGNTILPKMMVVAIPNTDRTRDLSPSHVDQVWGDSVTFKNSGGGDKFLEFMESELIPFIEKKYPAANHRTFVGHSLGGLLTIYSLIKNPALFDNYIAIDPSLWWDNQFVFKMYDSLKHKINYNDNSLFIGLANSLPEGATIEDIRKDTSMNTLHERTILEMVDLAENETNEGLNFEWKYYENDHHGSVPLITEYDALRSFFSWYGPSGFEEFILPGNDKTTEELLKKVTDDYDLISEKFGFEVLPDESYVNMLGYTTMQFNQPEKAFAMFSLNIENYPKSANVYDSMGDYYLSQADTTNAITFFSKALELWDNPISKEKLEALKGEQ